MKYIKEFTSIPAYLPIGLNNLFSVYIRALLRSFPLLFSAVLQLMHCGLPAPGYVPESDITDDFYYITGAEVRIHPLRCSCRRLHAKVLVVPFRRFKKTNW